MPPPPGYILQLLHTLFIAHNGTLSSAPLQSRHRPHLHQHYQLHLHSFGLSRLNIYQTSELTTECIFQFSKKKKWKLVAGFVWVPSLSVLTLKKRQTRGVQSWVGWEVSKLLLDQREHKYKHIMFKSNNTNTQAYWIQLQQYNTCDSILHGQMCKKTNNFWYKSCPYHTIALLVMLELLNSDDTA